MAFMLFCLRPAARVLEPPARVTLMHAAMKRFLSLAGIAIAVLFVCGAAMLGIAWSAAARAGLAFNMPLDWYTMIATFFVMLAVFIHIRNVLFKRLDAAVTAAKWPDGAARSRPSAGRSRSISSSGPSSSSSCRLGGTALRPAGATGQRGRLVRARRQRGIDRRAAPAVDALAADDLRSS
jgi:uncharacterized membrane protein